MCGVFFFHQGGWGDNEISKPTSVRQNSVWKRVFLFLSFLFFFARVRGVKK